MDAGLYGGGGFAGDHSYDGVPLSHQTPPLPTQRPDFQSMSLVKELSPQQYILRLIQELRGLVYDPKTEKYEKVSGVIPLMNEKGITLFFHLATSSVNEITTFSNYRDDMDLIYKLMRKYIKDAVTRFHFYYKDFGITDKSHVAIIIDKLQGVMLSAYFKALGAGDRKAATSNVSENISRIARDQQEEQTYGVQRKSGFFGRMFGKR